MPRDDLILCRDGDSKLLLAFRFGTETSPMIAMSSMDGVNWMESGLARAAMFDLGSDAEQITIEEARKLHPNLVLPG